MNAEEGDADDNYIPAPTLSHAGYVALLNSSVRTNDDAEIDTSPSGGGVDDDTEAT